MQEPVHERDESALRVPRADEAHGFGVEVVSTAPCRERRFDLRILGKRLICAVPPRVRQWALSARVPAHVCEDVLVGALRCVLPRLILVRFADQFMVGDAIPEPALKESVLLRGLDCERLSCALGAVMRCAPDADCYS